MKKHIKLFEEWKSAKNLSKVNEADAAADMATFISKAPTLYNQWIAMAKQSAKDDARQANKNGNLSDFYKRMEDAIKRDMQPYFASQGDVATRATSFYTSAITYIGGIYNTTLDLLKNQTGQYASDPGMQNTIAAQQKAATEAETTAKTVLDSFIKNLGTNMAETMNKAKVTPQYAPANPAVQQPANVTPPATTNQPAAK